MTRNVRLALLACILSLYSFGQANRVQELINMGVEYHDQGQFNEAIGFFHRAVALEPENSAANYELANTYYALGEYDNAEKYARKVLAMADQNQAIAAMTVGNALDKMGRSTEALEIYETALATSEHYLLSYNYAVTCFGMGEIEKAYNSTVRAIELNVGHASSHRLLSQIMERKGSVIQAMMPLYIFLLLEPRSDRSANEYEALRKYMDSGISQTSDSQTLIEVPSGADDAFGPAEMMIRLVRATDNEAIYQGKTDLEMFAIHNERIFKILGELSKGKSGFWWDLYVRLLANLAREGHTEAFSYYISISQGYESEEWIASHPEPWESFGAWLENYN